MCGADQVQIRAYENGANLEGGGSGRGDVEGVVLRGREGIAVLVSTDRDGGELLLEVAAVVAAEGGRAAAVRGAAQQALVAQDGGLGRGGGAGTGAAGRVAGHGDVGAQQQRRAGGGATQGLRQRPRAGHASAAAVGRVRVAGGASQRRTAGAEDRQQQLPGNQHWAAPPRRNVGAAGRECRWRCRQWPPLLQSPAASDWSPQNHWVAESLVRCVSLHVPGPGR